MWSQCLCMLSIPGGTRPVCRTCSRICSQWAMASWWRVKTEPPVPLPAVLGSAAAAGVLCRCCGAQAAKPAASSTATLAPTLSLLRPVTMVSSR